MPGNVSSTPPISRSVSFAVPESSDSEGDMKGCVSFGEKCLSTILRLDKEHNMFGLSNITIVDSKMLKKSRKDDKDPAFPQTTIIQLLCCEKKCCHKCGKCYSCTDPFCSSCKSCGIVCSLPCTLPCVVSARSSRALPCPKPSIRITPCGSPCGRRCRSPCRSPCFPPCRSPCSSPCRSPCSPPCRSPCRSPCARPSKIPFLKPTPCKIPCGTCCDNPPCMICCYKGRIKCKRVPCAKPRCLMDCNTRYGMKISLKRKPKFEPSPVEITPRSSCILKKPVAARSCHHLPRCSPPSSCFPYLMPCFWPPRASAPCNNPSRCFHNPPCLPPRRRKSPIPSQYSCTRDKKCLDETKNSICPNPTCPGKNETFKAEIEKRFGKGK
ncbi:keratin-associated protein 9-1-like [Papilio machaon]|uniref:keratin-associated protein 9-1-like n=1 Tax=Papilio machaon TaxID=76193 RepID=UPI001E663285|nr:keratin-associated protein 9-1-like [Papilio machaon]